MGPEKKSGQIDRCVGYKIDRDVLSACFCSSACLLHPVRAVPLPDPGPAQVLRVQGGAQGRQAQGLDHRTHGESRVHQVKLVIINCTKLVLGGLLKRGRESCLSRVAKSAESIVKSSK